MSVMFNLFLKGVNHYWFLASVLSRLWADFNSTFDVLSNIIVYLTTYVIRKHVVL